MVDSKVTQLNSYRAIPNRLAHDSIPNFNTVLDGVGWLSQELPERNFLWFLKKITGFSRW